MICEACGQEMDPRRAVAGLLGCPVCGLVFADLSLSAVEVARLYDRNYFHDGEYVDYLGEKAVLQENFRRHLITLGAFVEGGSLFEIGAAYGFFLELASAHFGPVAGVDISAEAVAHARDELGLAVDHGEFLDLPLEPATWQTFCCWATMEHLTQPGAYTQRVAELLPPGGWFAFTTGDIGSLWARLAGRRWRLIHPPTHLWYFNRSSVEAMLQRAGLELCHYGHTGYYRTFNQAFHTVLAKRSPRLYQRLSRTALASRLVYVDCQDIMFVVARKPGGPA